MYGIRNDWRQNTSVHLPKPKIKYQEGYEAVFQVFAKLNSTHPLPKTFNSSPRVYFTYEGSSLGLASVKK